MELRGTWVAIALVGLSVAFISGFFLLGEDLRQDYHVASRGDTERTAVDLSHGRVAWLEDAKPGGAVLTYDLGAKKRTTLEPRNASLRGGIAFDGDLVAWMQDTPGGPRIRIHDLARGFGGFASAPGDNLTLVPHALEGRILLAHGTTLGSDRAGLWRLEVSVTGPEQGGASTAAVSGAAGDLAALSRGRAWWRDGMVLRAVDAVTGAPVANVTSGGPITSFDVDGDLVVWAEEHGNHRRVLWADIANASRGEVSASPADQHSPAVNGTKVVLVQFDGLVRFRDLATGTDAVLPARTQENIHLRVGPDWAAWLSGTIEGHNVFLTPVPPKR